MARKPTTHHLPEFSTLVKAYIGAQGITRYHFSVESGSAQPPYDYHVNRDGTRPVCECRTRHPYTKSCRLESPDYAHTMAERAKSVLMGKPVPTGF